MVRQLDGQVLGAHQVQPLSGTHRGPQLLRVWGLQRGEYSGGCPRSPEERYQVGEEFGVDSVPMSRGVLGRAGVLPAAKGPLNDRASQGGIFLTAP